MKYRSIRGTRDILPAETPKWQEIEDKARELLKLFGYAEIRTPVIEETALFVKSVGEDTDIVKKEMFSFVDRGERNISLRPEGTAPIIRAYLENNLHKIEPFQKLYYIGPMFRAERPQAGRLRQFHQIGIEAIGSDKPALDAEVINIAAKLLEASGLEGYKLRINNLGCSEDKKRLSGILKDMFSKKHINTSLCEDCKRRLTTNPLRILDCKNENCRAVIKENLKTADFLCQDCKSHFEAVLAFLHVLKIKYTVDPHIVRGLDYYTKTVFEFTLSELGAQDAVGAGGRYDNLISDMGGPRLGACGFAVGVDRMMLARYKAESAPLLQHGIVDVFIASIGKNAYQKIFSLADELRTNGISCDIDFDSRSLKSQMRTADSLGAKLVIIIGDDEIQKGEAVMRDMKTREQISVKFSDIAAAVNGKISQKED